MLDLTHLIAAQNHTVGLSHFIVVSIFLFAIGIGVILVKRNAIWILMGIELILNASGLNFVAFGFYNGQKFPNLDGQIMAIFIIIIAAAEAAIGLAIILLIYHHRRTIDPDSLTDLKE